MQLETDLTIDKLLSRTISRYGSRPALLSDGCRYTYGQLGEKIDETAGALGGAGIKRGDFVGLYGSNSVSGIITYYALMRIGATAVFLGAGMSGAELEPRLRAVPIKLVCFWGEFPLPVRGSKCPAAVDVTELCALPAEQIFASLQHTDLETCGAVDHSEAGDIDAILFTSGTTGSSKPVATTQFSRSNNALAQGAALGLGPDDSFCLVLPMHHCFSLSACILAAMAYGSCICIPASRRTKVVMQMIEKFRCTVFLSVPTYFMSIMDSADFGKYDLSSLRIGMMGGSMYRPELFCKIRRTLGIKLVPSLGQTEATAGLTMGDPDEPDEIASRTVGYFMEHIDGRIIDPCTDEEVPVGQIGEICIRGYNVMAGYYGMPEETAHALRGGRLHTGDLGYLDGDGRVYLVGRKKDLIIKGGENISPWEIECAILGDPRIEQTKIVSVPDEHYIEEVCACVVPRPGASVTPDEIRSLVAARLSKNKIPRYVLEFKELPLNANGKVNSAKLRELAIKMIDKKQTQEEIK